MASSIELLLLAQYYARPPVVALGTSTSGFTVTGTSFANLSPVFTVPANDAAVGTVYRLTAFGHGTQGSTAQAPSFEVLAGGTAGVSAGWPSSFCSTSLGFGWKMTGEVMITAAGSSGTWTSSLIASVNQTNISAGSESTGNTVNTASSWTIAIRAEWGSATGAPTITCDGGYLERIA